MPEARLTRSRKQARLTGERLRGASLAVIHHGPLERAAQTAGIIAEYAPGASVRATDLAGDYVPADPDLTGLPGNFAAFMSGYDAAERAGGQLLAAAAAGQFARPSAGTRPDGDGNSRELVVTHNLLIGWLVTQAMAAPDWRWLGTNQMNCGLSVIAYQPDRPAALITFNDAGHLPPELRWTGCPAGLRPPAG